MLKSVLPDQGGHYLQISGSRGEIYMDIIIEHRFTGNKQDLEKAADALILIYRAIGILPSNRESEKLALRLKPDNPVDKQQSKAG